MKRFAFILALFLLAITQFMFSQKKTVVWSTQEQPIYQGIKTLRSVPDDARGNATRKLALEIRDLPKTENKLELATALASLSTEGDFGQDTLQAVATTLSDALHEQPQPPEKDQPAYPYLALAQLQRYEHVQVTLVDRQYAAALDKLADDDEHRQHADFTLTDLEGRPWKLADLKGKVVLLNFWATWCPPCNRELPDLQALYEKYKDQGFVVLAVSDEEAGKVKPFIAKRKLTYPVLLDPGRKVNDLFEIEGIPKSFVYDRDGKIVAEAIDMRTRQQFDRMLAAAGLK
jgi:peroxiredoxin